MLNKFSIVLLFLLTVTLGNTQEIDFKTFKSLTSSGPIPEDFTVLSSEKYAREKSAVSSESKREQRDMEDFLLESNFQVEELLHSGYIIFGDPVSNYLNEIRKIIQTANPDLKKDIRIYTMLSNEANAFTFDNGIVIVTTGLVSQVENEAQLAYILCHEFVHYMNKHAISGYVENRRIDEKKGVYSSLEKNSGYLAKYRFAKDQETEADQEGLQLYMATQYANAPLHTVFDVLLYSYLPIDEVPFPTDYFNEGYFVLPEKLFLDTLQNITAEEDYDDSESTHPNIKTRKQNLSSTIPDTEKENGNIELVNGYSFANIQKIARYQGCLNYINEQHYEDALYQAYILLQDDPENRFLKRTIAQSLYYWSVYKSDAITPEQHKSYTKIEGELQQVYYLFRKISDRDATLLALRSCWELHLEEPENKLMTQMCVHLGELLATEHEITPMLFKTEQQIQVLDMKNQTQADSTNTAADTTNVNQSPGNVSKISKIKKKEEATDGEYWKYIFPSYINDPAFKALFVKTEETTDDDRSKKISSYVKTDERIKELVVVDPIWLGINERSKDPVEYLAGEKARTELRETIASSGNDLGIKITYLDHSDLKDHETVDYNTMNVLSRWLDEELSFYDDDINPVNSYNADLHALIDTYGTNYFSWIGIISVKEKEDNVGAKILGMIIYPLAPFLLFDLLSPENRTYYFNLVADASTGDFVIAYSTLNSVSNSKATQKSNIYYMLLKIRNR